MERNWVGRFAAPVSRELVHRAAVAEVFITDIERTSGNTFLVWAQWPRLHVFYGQTPELFDSALVVETLRQSTILIAHSQLGVPLDTQFLMPKMAVSMVPDRRSCPYHPSEVTIEVIISGVKEAAHGTAAFRTDATFMVTGAVMAKGTAQARLIEKNAYLRIRERRKRNGNGLTLPDPVTAESVGHASTRNVVLGTSAIKWAWPLRVDDSNPILFDHPLDHVPGVLLIEATRQALRLRLSDPTLDFTMVDVLFVSIAELSDDAMVIVEALAEGERTNAKVTIQAHGQVLMKAQASISTKKQVFERLAPQEQEDLRHCLHA